MTQIPMKKLLKVSSHSSTEPSSAATDPEVIPSSQANPPSTAASDTVIPSSNPNSPSQCPPGYVPAVYNSSATTVYSTVPHWISVKYYCTVPQMHISIFHNQVYLSKSLKLESPEKWPHQHFTVNTVCTLLYRGYEAQLFQNKK
ncbi:uncharacterized protein [Macrobrachium rosenbergii]|uniref:uncharacterized protein n=1 Tax=Macrobrachium rosenbergii TaxID=79674 RepID=UPI0034D47362